MLSCARFTSFAVLFGAALLVAGPAGAQDACGSCEKQLKLSKADWECFAKSIDRYLALKTDPVLVPFVQCHQQPASGNEALRSDPIIVPKQAPDGVKQYSRALRLSKLQLRCLQAKLPSVVKSPPEVFDLETNCPVSDVAAPAK
jgi:hypothetical protein